MTIFFVNIAKKLIVGLGALLIILLTCYGFLFSGWHYDNNVHSFVVPVATNTDTGLFFYDTTLQSKVVIHRTAIDTALRMVEHFEHEPLSDVAFKNIERGHLAMQLRERIKHPEDLYQGAPQRFLCGTAVVVFCFINYNPVAYVKAITDLYKTGACMVANTTIKTTPTIQNARMANNWWIEDPTGRYCAVDFMLLSALRYTENDGISVFFPDFNPYKNNDFINGTWPHEIADLLHTLGMGVEEGEFYRHSGFTPLSSCFDYGQITNIQKALLNHKLVILFIDYDNFTDGDTYWFSNHFGNHFIVAHDFLQYSTHGFAFQYWDGADANADLLSKIYDLQQFNTDIKGYWIVTSSQS